MSKGINTCTYTHIPEMFFERPAAHVTLSICFLFFAVKKNVHWSAQDWNKDIGGEVNNIIQVILLSTAMTWKREINIPVICFISYTVFFPLRSFCINHRFQGMLLNLIWICISSFVGGRLERIWKHKKVQPFPVSHKRQYCLGFIWSLMGVLLLLCFVAFYSPYIPALFPSVR